MTAHHMPPPESAGEGDRVSRALGAYLAVWHAWPDLTPPGEAEACRRAALQAALRLAVAEVLAECAAMADEHAPGRAVAPLMIARKIRSHALLVDLQLMREAACP